MPLPSDTFHDDKLIACNTDTHNGTDEIPIAAAGGETWTETDLWWSFLCNNVHSSEATHIASGALCAPPLCTSPWLLAALPPVLALLSLGQLQAPLLLL